MAQAPPYGVLRATLLHVAPGRHVATGEAGVVVWLDVAGETDRFMIPEADVRELRDRLTVALGGDED